MKILDLTNIADSTHNGFASQEAYRSREVICDSCDQKQKYLRFTFCNKCGCNMNLKARFAASKCPLDKWDKPQE
jgi:predicted Zn-ribbon and HTH transcriptional regulator